MRHDDHGDAARLDASGRRGGDGALRGAVLAIGVALALLLVGVPAGAADVADAERIRGVMRAIWDRPDAPLTVAPIVVAGDHAVAGWAQGEAGSRAVLRREAGTWNVYLCGGDALKSATELERAGVPPADARALARGLATAEAALAPEVLARFASFKGLIPLGANPDHGAGKPPPGHSDHDHQ